MTDFPYRCALIIGAGPGISASLARRLSKLGLQVGLAARDVEKLKPLAEETAAAVFAVDAAQPDAVAQLFLDMERQVAEPDIVIYNASARVPGPLSSVDPAAVEKAIGITTFGARSWPPSKPDQANGAKRQPRKRLVDPARNRSSAVDRAVLGVAAFFAA